MTAYLIFDPQDNLIFWYCDPKLERFLLLQADFTEVTGCSEDLEVIRNLLTLCLIPYVSAYRHLVKAKPRFDGIPHSYIAHQSVILII